MIGSLSWRTVRGILPTACRDLRQQDWRWEQSSKEVYMWRNNKMASPAAHCAAERS